MSQHRLPQSELPLGLEAYRNTALFSDHYLAERLPALPWFSRRRTASSTALREIQQVFKDADPERNLAQAPEAQCEEDIIRPVLAALGHAFLVQTPTAGARAKNFPDYALFKNAADRDAARSEVLANDFSRAIALAEGKHWDRDLDRTVTSRRDFLTNANPSFQIVNYLTSTGRRWGVLTNGRKWRLYYRDSPQPLERFYEVDLLELVRSSGADAFLNYFWGFFSVDALAPGADGKAHVERVLAGSSDYAADVGTELRSRVFAALTRIAAGFIKASGSATVTEAELRTIYDASLIVLYRILFAFFAEARDLLPLERNESYREQLSLYRLVRDIADARDRHRQFSSTQRVMWGRLIGLWRAIDRGDDDLGVPEYDGELFDDAAHPFVARHEIPDLYLADALDLVGRVPGETEAHFVDYRSLSVAHLGTVYEGLLEHTLEIADDQLGDASERLRLAPVRGRRRETGSYYTPDPVVRHIVRETLRPLVAGRSEQEILDLRVCDPAMGSGHFLVAAVEELALAIAQRHGEAADIPPAETRDGDSSPEHDLTAIKRRVVESCIWGVDVNPLAVELSKLSLWLATASRDEPLTFLDHRLRCGNSVLGMGADDMTTLLRRRAKAQVTVFEDALADERERALAIAHELQTLRADSVEAVDRMKKLFADQERARGRLRTVYDAAIAVAFSRAGMDDLVALLPLLEAREAEWAAAADRLPDVHDDRDLAPFHWELEFPEVFEKSGFDAVLGNPPYVSAWEMTRASPGLRDVLAALPKWRNVAKRHWDLFVLFVALAQDLVVDDGRFGLIVANPIMREKYAAPLRRLLLEGSLESITDFGETNVFEGVARETVVLVWQKRPPADHHDVVLYAPGEIHAGVV